MNGYSDKLIALDDRMISLGRPVPPVVSWLSGGIKGDLNARTAAWRAQLQAWEQANPEAAIDWLELREQYRAEDELIESRKWSEDDFAYQLLERLGAPPACLHVIRKPDDRACLRKAREWLLDGTQWSLVMLGGPGAGKTTAAAWAAHQLLMRRFRPRWLRCAAMVDSPMFGPSAELLKHQCREAAVLVLDDIGAGARELKPGSPWLGWLDDVLDARWGKKRKTIITSNLGAERLAAWLGDRLADRLNEGTIFGTSEPSMRGQPREPGES